MMELNKYLKKYLPSRISTNFRTLDGSDIKTWLESEEYEVIANFDTGHNGIAITSCGYHISSNGYVFIK